MTAEILCFSDLHIGAPYAIASDDAAFKALDGIKRELKAQLAEKPNAQHYCVLNGDIFEFMLKRYGTSDAQMLNLANRWLSSLVDDPELQNIRFRFPIGNHEALEPFYKLLDTFKSSREAGRFGWSTEGVSIGDALFFHGDPESLEVNDHRPQRRNAPQRIQITQEPKRLILSLAHTMGGAISRFHFPLHQTLQQVVDMFGDHARSQGITDIVIGHIHEPSGLLNYEYEGLRFHVSGTGVRGMHNQMIRMSQDDEGKVLDVRHAAAPSRQQNWLESLLSGVANTPATAARLL